MPKNVSDFMRGHSLVNDGGTAPAHDCGSELTPWFSPHLATDSRAIDKKRKLRDLIARNVFGKQVRGDGLDAA